MIFENLEYYWLPIYNFGSFELLIYTRRKLITNRSKDVVMMINSSRTASSIVGSVSQMVKCKKIVLNRRFDGMPKESDFKIIEEELPPLKIDEFLVEAVYLSVDPYMRAYAHNLPVGSTMIGTQVARILESKNSKYPVGKYVCGKFDWTSHAISQGQPNKVEGAGFVPAPRILPSTNHLSYALGITGMPGTTAYFGFLEICKPNNAETVVISGAAGAVGCIVGQIAKIKGCKVIGITGLDEKGRFLIDKLGFNQYINYKQSNLDEKLTELVPQGIDCYFDNVAGEISSTVMKHMNTFGRISVCGSISSYNYDVNNPPKVTVVQMYMLMKQLVMEGFQNYLYKDRFDEGIAQIQTWIDEGKLICHETVTDGFDNTTKAFIEMLEGKNIGKAIVEV